MAHLRGWWGTEAEPGRRVGPDGGPDSVPGASDRSRVTQAGRENTASDGYDVCNQSVQHVSRERPCARHAAEPGPPGCGVEQGSLRLPGPAPERRQQCEPKQSEQRQDATRCFTGVCMRNGEGAPPITGLGQVTETRHANTAGGTSVHERACLSHVGLCGF